MSFQKFTLADVRTSVRRKLGDTGYDAATIDECANDFQFELFNDNRIRFMEESTPLAISSGVTTVPFPDDFMTMLSIIIFYSATQYRDITKNLMAYNEFMRQYPDYSVVTARGPMEFTFFGEGIRLSARTDGAYTGMLDYLRSPVPLTADGTEWELPINYKEMAVLGTLEKVLFVDEELDTADFALDRLQSLRTSFIRNYGRGSGKVGPQTIGQGRGRSTYRVDKDF